MRRSTTNRWVRQKFMADGNHPAAGDAVRVNRLQTLRFLPALAGALCFLAPAAVAPAQTINYARYTVTDLGTIPSSSTCPCFFGIAVSDQGHVIGRFFGTNGKYHGFLWKDGVMVDIGSLGGGVTQVLAVNDFGVAVGLSENASGVTHAFRYQNSVMTDMGAQNGTYSEARAVNNTGDVAGMIYKSAPNSFQHATLWENGHPTNLGTFGGEYSEGHGINSFGHVVGWAWNPARNQRAFLWTPETGLIDLGDLGTPIAIASDVNDAGQVVGSAQPAGAAAGTTHAFHWEGGVITDLGVLPEAGLEGPFGPELVNTAATGINNAGQVVGNSYPGTTQPPLRPGPFIWRNGVMTNLNDLIGTSPWVIIEANGINNKGQIVGTARSASALYRAVLLTPVTHTKVQSN